MSATTTISANELSKTSGIALSQNQPVLQVYKYIDSNGNTVYASSVNNDVTNVKEIAITPPPAAEYAEQARLRSLRFEKVAEELGHAREKRQALREAKEKKRLERLALINQSKPYVYERNIYVRYPYRLWKTHRRGGHHNGSKPAQGPTVGHRTSSMNLPSSSFH